MQYKIIVECKLWLKQKSNYCKIEFYITKSYVNAMQPIVYVLIFDHERNLKFKYLKWSIDWESYTTL